MDESAALQVLAEIASIPTAPLHELAVASYVGRFLRELGIPFQVDPYGNLVTSYRRNAGALPIALVAHLDHPALEIVGVDSGSSARARLLGGVPAACFDRPVPVRIIANGGSSAATIVGCKVDPATGRVSSLELETGEVARPGDFGVFDLPGYQRQGDEVRTRAADDLAGVAAALLALRETVERGESGTLYAVFTRAEEIGLIGASLVAEQRLLPLDTIVISLECSRALPGATPGNGPVIRVGDRARSFHPEGEAILLAAREQIADVPVQRQLMSGGTCEATAFGASGYRTTGVALPLVNYHNVGPDDVISPESIHVRDFLGEIALLASAIRVARDNRPLAVEARLQQRVDEYRDHLRDTAPAYRNL